MDITNIQDIQAVQALLARMGTMTQAMQEAISAQADRIAALDPGVFGTDAAGAAYQNSYDQAGPPCREAAKTAMSGLLQLGSAADVSVNNLVDADNASAQTLARVSPTVHVRV
jgi:hypothetical protein